MLKVKIFCELSGSDRATRQSVCHCSAWEVHGRTYSRSVAELRDDDDEVMMLMFVTLCDEATHSFSLMVLLHCIAEFLLNSYITLFVIKIHWSCDSMHGVSLQLMHTVFAAVLNSKKSSIIVKISNFLLQRTTSEIFADVGEGGRMRNWNWHRWQTWSNFVSYFFLSFYLMPS